MKYRRAMILMRIRELFSILFAYTLILSISTNHLDVKSAEDIVTVYSAQDHPFKQLVVDKYGKWIYIAARQALHQLSSDLKLRVMYTTDRLVQSEKLVHDFFSNCTTDECDRILHGQYYSNKYDQILVLDYKNQQLITCGTFFYDICNAHDMSDVSKILETKFKPDLKINKESNGAVAFAAPYLLHHSPIAFPALYIGFVEDNIEQVQIRNLEKTNFLSVLRKNVTFNSINNSIPIHDTGFIKGFSFRNSSYFLTTGDIWISLTTNITTIGLLSGAGYLSKMDHKQEEDSYDSIFITCNSSMEHLAGQRNRIQHAYIYEYTNKSNSTSATDSIEVKKTFMFALFKLGVGRLDVGFVVSKYDMNNIRFTSQKNQILDEDLIFFHEGRPDVTAMAVTSVNNHIVLFLGTQAGHLKKVSIEGFHSPDADTANYYSDITIDEGSPVNSDLVLDFTNSFLYIMTEHKLTKVKTYNCDINKTPYECLRTQDPHCGWCFVNKRCCLKSECTDEQNNIGWISYGIYKYLNTSSISKNKFLHTVEWNETVSFIKSHPFDNLTMICSSYKTCSACVTSNYPCKWHVNNDRCTDETVWSSKDIVIGATLDHSCGLLEKAHKNGADPNVVGENKVQVDYDPNAEIIRNSDEQGEKSYSEETMDELKKYAEDYLKEEMRRMKSSPDEVPTATSPPTRRSRSKYRDSTISFFTPQLGPWEGGTTISINISKLGRRNVFPLSWNITAGKTACTIHPKSTDVAKEPLICVVEQCKSTFHNCSGPIEIIAKDLLLTSTTIFQFVDPEINDISPTTGSTSGGTELTINGEYLNAGDIIEVYIGDLECVVFVRHSKQLKCLTGPSKLSFKSYVNIQFDGHIRTSEDVYEYDENLGPDENIQTVPRGVPTGGLNTSIKFDISVQENITKQEDIFFYIQAKEKAKTYYSKCEISNISLICPIPNIDLNSNFLDEKKPKRMDYGFTLNPPNGENINDFHITKKYPKFLLYPDSVHDLLKGKIVKQQTTSIITKWLLENMYLFVVGLVILVVLAITISIKYWRKSAARTRKMQQQINIMGMERIALSQFVKRVVIEKQLELDENLSQMLKLPNVTIVYESYPIIDADEVAPTLRTEYELPLDEKWETPRENVVLGEFLGEGEFGRVVKGNVAGLLQEHIITLAAVKMLKNTHKDTDLVNLVTEMELLKLIGRHDNVISLLGCCTQNGPLLVIIEYSPHGNLLDFLRTHHQQNDLSEKVQLTFALQIARGMEYLASIRLIHRDLAARNILIFDDYVLKIADFGLAKDIRNSDYYKQKTKGRFPVKWIAPETITHRRHSPQSDVWSYGILLWEIVTFGEVPYATYDDTEKLLKDIRSGYRMKKPEDCSMDTYCLMVKCWNHLPENRPDFTRIIHDLEAILKKMNAVIEESDSDCSSISSVSIHKANETNSLLP